MKLGDFNHNSSDGGQLRGFVAYIAIALWFLLAVLSAGRASAAEGAPITSKDILPSIAATLAAHGAPEDGVVRLDHPTQALTDTAIVHTSYNPLSGRFVIRTQSASAVTGIIQRIERFAVLNRTIERGSVIGEADITYIETPATTARGLAKSADELTGKMARRTLAVEKPVRLNDLETPKLVKKGAIVTLTYQIEGLRMSHQGVSMHDGGAGDIVSVRNIHSDRTLKGVVADRNLVTIIPPRAAFKG